MKFDLKSLSFIYLILHTKTNILCSSKKESYQIQLLPGAPESKGWELEYDVLTQAYLALDVGLMYDLYGDEEKNVYSNGRPGTVDTSFTLQSLSKNALPISAHNPLYAIYSKTFDTIDKTYEGSNNRIDGYFDGQPASMYADSIVRDLFSLEVDGIEKDAVLVFTIWMRFYDYLYDNLYSCREAIANSRSKMKENIHAAAALWIGILQMYGSSNHGNMLYNMAEKSGAMFMQDNQQTRVNTEIIRLLKELEEIVIDIDSGYCVNGIESDAFGPLYSTTQQILGQMNVVLVQNLIHHLTLPNNDRNVELYFLAMSPQIYACDPPLFEFFMNKVVKNHYSDSPLDILVDNIQKMYTCLGISCNDVGSYLNNVLPSCKDEDVGKVEDIAGYAPSSDVRKYIKFDRDSRIMQILFDADLKDAARELYWKGRNMKLENDNNSLISLRDMALHEDLVDSSGKKDRFYAFFETKNGPTYADDMIENMFSKDTDPKFSLSTAVDALLQGVVTPHYSLRNFFASVDLCKGGDVAQAKVHWDRGVAVLIGSNTSQSSSSWYSLSDQFCDYFQCVNNRLPSLRAMAKLKAGLSALNSNDCVALESVAKSLEPLILLPLLQGLMFHAEKAELNYYDNGIELHAAYCYAYTTALLPLLYAASPQNAQIIEKEMITGFHNIPDAEAVYNAVALIHTELALECEDFGTPKGAITGNKSFCVFAERATLPPVSAPTPTISPPTEPTSKPTSQHLNTDGLSWLYDRYGSLENVEKTLLLALDLRDIISFSGNDSAQTELKEAEDIYSKGKNSGDSSFTLKKISSSSLDNRKKEPYHIFYKHALNLVSLYGVDADYDAYVSMIVNMAFETGNLVLIYDAILLLVVWTEVVHNLTVAYNNCVESVNSGDKIDEAVALYVGAGQKEASKEGFSLYSLAQKMGATYGTLGSDGESKANTAIIELFTQAKSLANTCESADTDEPRKNLRGAIQKIVAKMNIPLIQKFLHVLKEDLTQNIDTVLIILYGVSTLPQVAVCKEDEYLYLAGETFATGVDNDNIEVVMEKLKNMYSCFGVTCADIHGKNNAACPVINPSFAGYVPMESSVTKSYIDRDIAKILLFIEEDQYQLAEDYYLYGDQTFNEDLSLYHLATGELFSAIYNFDIFNDYHGGKMLGDNKFQDLLGGGTNGASDAALRIFQSFILLDAAIGSFYMSVKKCEEGESAYTVIGYWDSAVAYLIGSVEGPQNGGLQSDYGFSVFSLAKEMCFAFFDTCTEQQHAYINDVLLNKYNVGLDMLTSAAGGSNDIKCSNVKNFIADSIIPKLLVPIIQANYFFAVGGSSEFNPGVNSAEIFADALYPLIMSKNETSANTIKTLSSMTPSEENGPPIAEAFFYVFNDLGITCEDVSFPDFDCLGNSGNGGTNFATGLYVTKTFVEDIARIDLDVKDMIEYLLDGNIDMAKNIYLNGHYSKVYDGEGKEVGIRSLSKFSSDHSSDMKNDVTFNLYRYALKDYYGNFLDKQVDVYADTYIMSLFEQPNVFGTPIPQTLPAEAAVVLNIWNFMAHKLHSAVAMCENGNQVGVKVIDEVVAYWLGYSQQSGASASSWLDASQIDAAANKGFLLYSIAEASADWFGQAGVEDNQGRVNKQLSKLFKEASLQLSFSTSCANIEVAKNLRVIVDRIISQMSIPLIQHLIYNLKANNRARVQLYAYAVVPLLAPCSKSKYEYLKQKLITSSYEQSDVNNIIGALQDTYYCLGLKCNDIGDPLIYDTPECKNRSDLRSLGDYKPKYDVQELSDIDIDVRLIEILMDRKAYIPAWDIYRFGKNSISKEEYGETVISLQSLANSNNRRLVPSFELFEKYFGNNFNYANDFMAKAIPDHPDNVLWSKEQRKAAAVTALNTEVLTMGAYSKFHNAASSCENADEYSYHQSRKFWDEGAALLIGSFEGVPNSKIDDGYLMYGLGNQMCEHFLPTCGSNKNVAKVNERLMELLYSGSSAVSSLSCGVVKEIAEMIESAMMVPLIQATLKAAYENTELIKGTNDQKLASGYVYSRSILPYISYVDISSAVRIKNNLNLQFEEKPVKDGGKKVYEAMEMALERIEDVSCVSVGYNWIAKLSVCPKGILSGSGSSQVKIAARGITLTLVILSVTSLLF